MHINNLIMLINLNQSEFIISSPLGNITIADLVFYLIFLLYIIDFIKKIYNYFIEKKLILVYTLKMINPFKLQRVIIFPPRPLREGLLKLYFSFGTYPNSWFKFKIKIKIEKRLGFYSFIFNKVLKLLNEIDLSLTAEYKNWESEFNRNLFICKVLLNNIVKEYLSKISYFFNFNFKSFFIIIINLNLIVNRSIQNLRGNISPALTGGFLFLLLFLFLPQEQTYLIFLFILFWLLY
jgi:hypothetical protein